MTLTYRTINRSRRVLWLVGGREKAAKMLLRACAPGDASIPAGRVAPDHALLLADYAAAGQLMTS